ncbi:hypothetical protein BGZ75_000629 [Mortierella antarctica]|nr:hypothetical protein BGZ75_000629 [Mortierella antarctica]
MPCTTTTATTQATAKELKLWPIQDCIPSPHILQVNYAQVTRHSFIMSTRPPPPIWTTYRIRSDSMSDASSTLSTVSSPTSSISNCSTDSLDCAADRLKCISPAPGTASERSLEATQKEECTGEESTSILALSEPAEDNSELTANTDSSVVEGEKDSARMEDKDASNLERQSTSTSEESDPEVNFDSAAEDTAASSFTSESLVVQEMHLDPTTASIPEHGSMESTLVVQDPDSEKAEQLDLTPEEHEPAEPAPQPKTPQLSSWDIASEHVATVALQCLNKDKDMELSYVAILSAMTVLQSKHDHSPDKDDSVAAKDDGVQEANLGVAALYSQILRTMCRPDVAESLSKEIVRQGTMAPEALYSQLYGSIQQAGYSLQDEAHLSMAHYWTDRRNIEEAQDCISNVRSDRWTGAVFRAAIICHTLSKPRQLQEAEVLLQKYIELNEKSYKEDVASLAKTWYRLQLDSSKWEEVKIQYERRRAGLLKAPATMDRTPATPEPESQLTSQALQQHQLHEQQKPAQRQHNHERSVSVASSSTSSSHRRSPSGPYSNTPLGHQRSPSGHQRTSPAIPSWPSGASATLNASVAAPTPVPTKGAFSFLSTFKFATKGGDGDNSSGNSSSLPSRIHVNRHLTVLDNNMLEECIVHKEFEYGWTNVYEKMGPALEDGETARIAMRLCRRAFLGHGGLLPSMPGSPNVVARDMYFEDGLEMEHETRSRHQPELWEARAWVVYNKAMVNPHTFISNTYGPSAHSQSVSMAATTGTGASSTPANSSHALSQGASPTSMFMHDILTIAIHSPEVSSRYLKAFKIYSAMRSDPHNQHQLRDPLVMTCMLKAIYDAVLAVVHGAEQAVGPEQKIETLRQQRRTSSISLNRAQPLTIGPLVDLAFEIYADMRNIGSIRHLPSLISLAPTSPTSRVPHSVGTLAQLTAASSTATGTSSTTEPSEVGTVSSVSISPRSSFSVLSMTIFQDLNPSLKPSAHARRLSPELYLALLHLCIQIPVFRISAQVVKTIVDDMTASSGRPPMCLDYQLAAALQCFHDSWMCSIEAASSTEGSASDQQVHGIKCGYHEWMYRSEEEIQSDSTEASTTLSGSLEDEVTAETSTGSPQTSCNEDFYWDFWSSEDLALKNILFSRRKATMLFQHMAQALM